MFSSSLDSRIFLIDLKPYGFSHFIASYVISAERVAIVETGPVVTVPNLLAGLDEIGVDVEDVDYVVVSHIHLDHSGGAGVLLRHLPRAKLVVHRKGAFHMANPEKLWMRAKEALGEVAVFYERPAPVAKNRIIVAEHGMTFSLGDGFELEVIETLGHASHHQSYYERRSQSAFSGDAAGIYIREFDTIIPTTPPPLRLEAMLASILRLKNLQPRSLYYSHFGGTTDASEKLQMYIDQLRLWADIVSQKAGKNIALEEIRDEIMRNDPATRKVKDYVRTHPVLGRGTVIQNIQGFISHFRNLHQ